MVRNINISSHVLYFVLPFNNVPKKLHTIYFDVG